MDGTERIFVQISRGRRYAYRVHVQHAHHLIGHASDGSRFNPGGAERKTEFPSSYPHWPFPPLLPLAPILLERHKLREARSRFHHPLLPRRFSFDVSPNGIPLRTSARTCKHLTVFLRDYAATRETAARFKAGKNIPLRGQEILLDRC